jgi:hypothetical protein
MFLDVIRATIANNGYEVITCGVASAFFALIFAIALLFLNLLEDSSLTPLYFTFSLYSKA